MAELARAHADVGGELVSAGGTGTYDLNELATEIQAGSYALMDLAYGGLGLPFRRALVGRGDGHLRQRARAATRSPTAG